MNIEELKNLTGGYIPSELNGTEYTYSNVIAKASRNIAELPLSFRLWTSGVKNQVDKSSCVAHAISSMKEIQDYYDTKSIEKYSTSWIYLMRDADQYQGSGMYIKEAMANMKEYGVVPYSMLPGNIEFSDGKAIINKYKNNSIMKEEAKKHRINSYVMTRMTDEIKQSLFYDYSPVVIGILVYESFYNTKSNGIVAVPDTLNENYYGGHALLITGWVTIGDKEYWVVQNSWGENWGDNGFCYLEIKKFPIQELWTSIDLEDYPCNLTDINEHWNKEIIEKCVKSGLINGFEDNTFRPDEPLTRAQFCSVIWKMLDKVTK